MKQKNKRCERRYETRCRLFMGVVKSGLMSPRQIE